MVITSIKQQVKRADRYSIYVDGKYVCSLSEGKLVRAGLRIGQELSEGELESLKNDAVRDKARTRAFDQLSRRPRSEWELRDYLKRKGYDEDVADDTLTYLKELGYIDDLKFAKLWVENRRLLKPVSKRRLHQELRQKRVADDIIKQVLEEDEADERQVLRELVDRKKSKYPDKLKFMRYLAGQGYSYDDIKSVLEDNETD